MDLVLVRIRLVIVVVAVFFGQYAALKLGRLRSQHNGDVPVLSVGQNSVISTVITTSIPMYSLHRLVVGTDVETRDGEEPDIGRGMVTVSSCVVVPITVVIWPVMVATVPEMVIGETGWLLGTVTVVAGLVILLVETEPGRGVNVAELIGVNDGEKFVFVGMICVGASPSVIVDKPELLEEVEPRTREDDCLVEVAGVVVVLGRDDKEDVIGLTDHVPNVRASRVSVTVTVDTVVETKVEIAPETDVVTSWVYVVRENIVETETETDVEIWMLVDGTLEEVRVMEYDLADETLPTPEVVVEDAFDPEDEVIVVVFGEGETVGREADVAAPEPEAVRVDEPGRD